MVTTAQISPYSSPSRVGWVDIVKGMSIFLVVMMHSTLGVENAAGETSWMGAIVEFCRPFRIPCFMLVSGLFLHKTIDGDWSRYLDRKVLHFVYFYVLWVAIQVVVKTPGWMGEGQYGIEILQTYLATFYQPFGTLWFIYMLPVFYLVTRILREADWRLVLANAMLLQIMPIHSGFTLIDEFASRFVYFYIGFIFYDRIFAWAKYAAKHTVVLLMMVAAWFLANLFLTGTDLATPFQHLTVLTGAMSELKLADLPLISLIMGIAGALVMIAVGSLILHIKFLGFMRWVGEHSIVIYLAFFLPMGASRVVLLKYGTDHLSVGMISAIVTVVAAISPLLFYWFVNKTGFGLFLFRRPNFLKLIQDKAVQSSKALRVK